MSGSADHPDVDELHKRVSKVDSKISIATVYRTVKLFEEAGIVAKHDFKGNKSRYEQAKEEHHDHLIDVNTGEITEFSNDDIEKLEDKIFSKYDSVYDGVVDIATNGIKVFGDLKLPKKTLDVIEEVSMKIKLPSVEIRGVLELADSSSNGVETIKNSLQGFEKTNQDNVKILYIGAPRYRISVTASDFKSAEKTLKPILEDIQKNIEKNKGSFKFTREESKKAGGE